VIQLDGLPAQLGGSGIQDQTRTKWRLDRQSQKRPTIRLGIGESPGNRQRQRPSLWHDKQVRCQSAARWVHIKAGWIKVKTIRKRFAAEADLTTAGSVSVVC